MAQGSRNGRTILVAEDEPEVRGYLEMALKCLGYSVELAQDGDEAEAEHVHSSSDKFAQRFEELTMALGMDCGN
jgi:CheY-like chemotaxis protein